MIIREFMIKGIGSFMKRYVTAVCLFVATSIIFISISILTCSAKMTQYLTKRQESLIVSRGIDGLENAQRILADDLEKKVEEACDEAFLSFSDTLYEDGVNISEKEALDLYRRAVLEIVKGKYGIKKGSVSEAKDDLVRSLDDMLPSLKTGELSIDGDSFPHLVITDDTITIKNIDIDYVYKDVRRNGKVLDVSAKVCDMIFYDENENLFSYSMVAGKGIYITGKTSTIMGNIYAGTHSPSEMRKAEALYAESGSYGGINIMSTQLAINAEKIVTDGNINMKGSFVVLGEDTEPITIYANDIMESDNIASHNIYELYGVIDNGDISGEREMIKDAMKYLSGIVHYYDSDNDMTYRGQYRKLISGMDITLKSDVTGVVMTPGCVIIEDGVNVEGLIISGDRIYVQGNNNIVSSVEVLRGILREEFYGDIYEEDESGTIEEKSRNSVHLDLKDYLGGILRRGIVR